MFKNVRVLCINQRMLSAPVLNSINSLVGWWDFVRYTAFRTLINIELKLQQKFRIKFSYYLLRFTADPTFKLSSFFVYISLFIFSSFFMCLHKQYSNVI